MYAHILGLPRIGPQRELKRALESYWSEKISLQELRETERALRMDRCQIQKKVGLDLITAGDFSLYDHVLDTSLMLGCVPDRVRELSSTTDLDQMFLMARGRSPNCPHQTAACRMTKWFNTNYHYIVPEVSAQSTFHLNPSRLLEQIKEAGQLKQEVKPVILGPVSWLYLADVKTSAQNASKMAFDRLRLLPDVVEKYAQLLEKLSQENINWVQIDEPVLTLDLNNAWRDAFETTYQSLAGRKVRLMLATYFGSVAHNLELIAKLNVEGVHLDLVTANSQLEKAAQTLDLNTVLSLGLVNGCNIWLTDLSRAMETVNRARQSFATVWTSTSCSLLHSPYDLNQEPKLDATLKSWMSFSVQKLGEVALIRNLCSHNHSDDEKEKLSSNGRLIAQRAQSKLIHNQQVQDRIQKLADDVDQRPSDFATRIQTQKERLNLPLYPTTTIGSFPQTSEVRRIRRQYKNGQINQEQYQDQIRQQIEYAVRQQESYGLDVLVHGEAERNDMVEYFGESLTGIAFTENGWVQSYGSRCVKPPVIYGDVLRPAPISVDYTRYAQSLTKKPMKGMLTGPITILHWSFVRDDQPAEDTCLQIALALRDEVKDLETAGIKIIQIDEPALREGLPLRQEDWAHYVAWATRCFRISAGAVEDGTQIHTHMCYSSFSDVIEAIVKMDADVISIESARSDMAILQSFVDFKYPNEIGLGVYDIHSPNAPDVADITNRLHQAEQYIPARHLWVNPDCGLKTRQWSEVALALNNMVVAATKMRQRAASQESS